MYVVIASGIVRVVDTAEDANKLKLVYPYAKMHYAVDLDDAYAWIHANTRKQYTTRVKKFGSTSWHGYIQASYFITDDALLVNYDLTNFGRTRIMSHKDVLCDNRRDLIKMKVKIRLDNNIIQHHVMAIDMLLEEIGQYCDIDLVLPDMSIYLALMYYDGTDRIIQHARYSIRERIGGVSYTVK